MQYEYTTHTQNHAKGDIVEIQPEAVRTKELLARGFIRPLEPKAPVAETRETKPSRQKRERKNAATANK